MVAFERPCVKANLDGMVGLNDTEGRKKQLEEEEDNEYASIEGSLSSVTTASSTTATTLRQVQTRLLVGRCFNDVDPFMMISFGIQE